MIIRTLATITLLASVVAPLSAQSQRVTLEEALRMALRASPQVAQAEGSVSNAAWARREVVGSWLPSLNVSSSLSQSYNGSSQRLDPTTQQLVGGTTTSYSAGFNASMELFDGFRRFAENRSTKADAATADAALVNQEFQVMLQTKQAFFGALAAGELVRVSETRLQRAREQLKISRDKLANGTAIRSDTLRNVVEVGNAELQLLNARTSLATTEASLARLIGVDGTASAASDPALLEPVRLDTAQLRGAVLIESPAVIQAEAASRSAQAGLSVARAAYFPTLSASYGNSWSGRQLGSLDGSGSLRVSLSWPLFNGFRREASMSRSAIAAEVAQSQAEDARRQVNAQLTQYFASLAAAQSRHMIAVASIAAAQEDLRIQQERYRLGAATIVEVLTVQQSLDQAEVDRIQALFDYLVAKAQIESLMGREL